LKERTLVVGLGNPILGDDGVGWQVAKVIEAQLGSGFGDLEIIYCSIGGIALMEQLVGYDQALLIDSISTGKFPVGATCSLPLGELPSGSTAHSGSAHDTNLQTALRVGRSMGYGLPGLIWVVGIETEAVFEFSEKCSPAIEASIPRAADVVIGVLDSWRKKAVGEPLAACTTCQ